MFTVILRDGSELSLSLCWLASYIDQIAEVYSDNIKRLSWRGQRQVWSQTLFPNRNFVDALQLAVKSGDWSIK